MRVANPKDSNFSLLRSDCGVCCVTAFAHPVHRTHAQTGHYVEALEEMPRMIHINADANDKAYQITQKSDQPQG